MKLDEFDYPLPKELIAQAPLKKRDDSKLMVVKRGTGEVFYNKFSDVLNYIDDGDVLVINDTRVFPARLFGKKQTGGKVELLLVSPCDDAAGEVAFTAMSKASKPMKVGQELFFSDDLTGVVTELLGEGRIKVTFSAKRDFYEILDEIGMMPLPPYIKRGEVDDASFDKSRYQTVYAENVGAIAAPTAGFHFTEGLLDALRQKGVKIANVTLHVGLGTFLPVRVENIKEHKMHEEFFRIDDKAIEIVTRAKRAGKRVIAVGTTSVRTLESAFDAEMNIIRKEGTTGIFIYPGYDFKVIDAMITNFHLPKSTLFMLVCAFGGIELMKRAYRNAVEKSFRFFSYGDAMFIE